MGTKAIFKIYNEGKFVIGSWVKYDGGVSDTSIFPYFLKNIMRDADKKSIYDIINQFISDGNYRTIFGDKKIPFIRQINDDGMNETEVLFWDTSLSDVKLYREGVWGEYRYEVRFTKDKVKIKVIYNGHEKIYVFNRFPNMDNINIILKELNNWVDDIEYGLNDCNCGEDNKEITE